MSAALVLLALLAHVDPAGDPADDDTRDQAAPDDDDAHDAAAHDDVAHDDVAHAPAADDPAVPSLDVDPSVESVVDTDPSDDGGDDARRDGQDARAPIGDDARDADPAAGGRADAPSRRDAPARAPLAAGTVVAQLVAGALTGVVLLPVFCVAPLVTAYVVTAVGNALDDADSAVLPSAYAGYVGFFVAWTAVALAALGACGGGLALVVLSSMPVCVGALSPLAGVLSETGCLLFAVCGVYAAPVVAALLLGIGSAVGATVGNQLVSVRGEGEVDDGRLPRLFRAPDVSMRY